MTTMIRRLSQRPLPREPLWPGRLRPALAACGLLLLAAVPVAAPAAPVVWLEAEAFANVGGWSRDTQHVDLMGSVYLLATGLGKPVEAAVTTATIPEPGTYRLWVRARDWLPAHAPGRFVVRVAGKASPEIGRSPDDDRWRWFDGGEFQLEAGKVEVRLEDATGWWGRCDAIVLAGAGFTPADDLPTLAAQRERFGGVSAEFADGGAFDVVIVGAGPAGMGAAVGAARRGAKVALLQDRPVVGGNSSDEIQVPPMGWIGEPPDRINVTGACEELYPLQGWRNFADSTRMEALLRGEPGLTLHTNTRCYGAELADNRPPRPLAAGERGGAGRIAAVLAVDVTSGRRIRYRAPIFIDCTGHGWVGFYAGAEYRQGEEAREEFGESLAPELATPRTQGNTLYQAVFADRDRTAVFNCPPWAYQWTKAEDFEPRGSHRRLKEIRRPVNFDEESRGTGRVADAGDSSGGLDHGWWVEYGGMEDTITDAESIRDELLRITLGLWNYAKNHNPRTIEANANRELVWLNYVPGGRESRRLMGLSIMTQADFNTSAVHPDAVAFTDWGIDVHHPQGFWVRGNDCIHVYHGRRVTIPLGSLVSRNITNLLMAGRNISATHIALGATRVMRPCMGMGQAAGIAAAIAAAGSMTPATVARERIAEVQQELLKQGCYVPGVRNADPRDLAREGTVTASSAAEGRGPDKVIDGVSRIVGEDPHAWRPAADGPAWILLTLPRAAAANTLHLTFEEYRSVPFVAEVAEAGGWRTVAEHAEVDSTRRHVLRFARLESDRVRIRFAEPVGVCEVRLYDEPAGEEAPPAAAARPPVVLPGLTVDFANRCVDIEATVCLDDGLLELIACTRGSKEHESIVAVAARPMHIHTALLLLGAVNGQPAMRRPGDPAGGPRWIDVPPSGDPVDVFLVFEGAEGQVEEHPISEFVALSEEGRQALAAAGAAEEAAAEGRFPDTFLFAGSQLRDNGEGPRTYLADESGDVISIATFGDELLCLDGIHGQADDALVWQVNPDKLPQVGTMVTLRLRVREPVIPPAPSDPPF
jgi:hypothetical protein